MRRVNTEIAAQGPRTEVKVSGVLSERTASRLRDDLVKCSAEGPDVLVVDVDAMTVTADRLLSVFGVVARRLGQWPGAMLVLVCGRPDLRAALARKAIDRFVPVVDDAGRVDEVVTVPRRRRAWRELPRDAASSHAARSFVRDICAGWEADAFADFATSIVGELVENTIKHTMSGPQVRLELRRGMFTVAVSDESPARPVLREAPLNEGKGLGLRIVGELARVWGTTPTPSGGKVVWAVLTEASLRSRQHRHG